MMAGARRCLIVCAREILFHLPCPWMSTASTHLHASCNEEQELQCWGGVFPSAGLLWAPSEPCHQGFWFGQPTLWLCDPTVTSLSPPWSPLRALYPGLLQKDCSLNVPFTWVMCFAIRSSYRAGSLFPLSSPEFALVSSWLQNVFETDQIVKTYQQVITLISYSLALLRIIHLGELLSLHNS